MRILADSNMTRAAVGALRAAGYDVVWVGERHRDPGDAALLTEAHAEGRVFLTKDHDLGVLVFRDAAAHAGIMLIDELHRPEREAELVISLLERHGPALLRGAFLRCDATGVREAGAAS